MTSELDDPKGILEPMRKPELPALESLHERHPGLTANLAGSMAEAAFVCLARHHPPPATDLAVAVPEATCIRVVGWTAPDERTTRAWANHDDATEYGAYSIALASVEAELGLFAVGRADVRTGADFYVGEAEQDDLEMAHRLEVSGTDEGDEHELARRVRRKLRQAAAGRSDRPAIVAVVAFLSKQVAIAPLIDEDED